MNNQYFKELLNSRDLKATSQRLKLLVHMHEYTSAMPYSAIKKSMESIDRVTLYRTIETLVDQGVIHQAFRENSDIYYAICGKKCGKNHHHHDHIHFKCVQCDAVICEELDNSVKIALPEYEIHKVTIHLEGVCKLCKKGNA